MIFAPALNKKQEVLHLPGVSEIVVLKKPHQRTEEIKIGQWKGYYMEHCGSGTPKPANEKPNNSLMWPTTVLSLFFSCRNFCAENLVIFFYEIKLLFTYLALDVYRKSGGCVEQNY